MAGALTNLAALFRDSRSRVIILLTGFLLLVAILIGIFVLRERTTGLPAAVSLPGTPGIQSIPGGMEPTTQYAKLVEQHNIEQAEEAAKTGKSVMPTIVRFQKYGEGQSLVGGEAGQAGLGFSSLAQKQKFGGGAEKEIWFSQLKDSNCSAETVRTVLQQGASLKDVATVCSCTQLRANGFDATSLKPVCQCESLKAAGFNALDLKNAGFDARQLQRCGFDACQVKGAGFSAQDMIMGGFSEGELKGAGFSAKEITEALGLPAGITAEDVQKVGCDVTELQRLRANGVSANAIRQISGCPVNVLKAAGYTADELKRAGYTAAELKSAGFEAAELLAAGYAPADLLYAGFDPVQVRSLTERLPNGITEEAVKKAGCDPAALAQLKEQGVSAAAIQKISPQCSAAQLKAAGFSAAELAGAGFSSADIAAALMPGLSPTELKKIADLLQQLKTSNCSVALLKQAREAGISAEVLRKTVGCNAAALRAAGFNAAEMKKAGYSAAELRQAGYSPQDLRAAGYSARELKEAGFSARDLKAAGFGINELKSAGYDALALAEAGFSAQELKSAGYTVDDLKAAGLTAAQLKEAGFTAEELKKAGFSAIQLQQAGFSAKELIAAGYTVKELKEAGFDALTLKDAGLSASQLAEAGFTLEQLKFAKFSATDLQLTGLVIGGIEAAGAGNATDREAQMNEALARQASQISEQQLQQQIQQKMAALRSGVAETMVAWEPVTQVYIGGSALEGGVAGGEGRTAVISGVSSGEQQPGTLIIKTGDVMFAVLDTSLNSDEPGPVLATVVSGKFKGAKLIGSLTLPANGQKVILSFNRMSIPDVDETVAINAVAIDPDTARTALSSKTNNHYLLRYGSLLASSFMEGFGSAVQSAGFSFTSNAAGGFTIAQAQRSTAQSALSALGKVGQRWGNQIGSSFNRPPTVEVYAGTGMGILFTGDVSINK